MKKKNKTIKATVHIYYQKLPRQLSFQAQSEKELFEKVYQFLKEHKQNVKIRQLCYHGQNITWENLSEGIYLYFEKKQISFEIFHEQFIEYPQISTK